LFARPLGAIAPMLRIGFVGHVPRPRKVPFPR
jgi:hypothetical protein